MAEPISKAIICMPMENSESSSSTVKSSEDIGTNMELSVVPRSGEVVDVNERSNEALVHELEKKLMEQVVYSEEEAYILYCDYAQALGFNVRRGKQYYFMGTKRVRSKSYYCTKEGVKCEKSGTKAGSKYKKTETRTECKAMISFACDDSGQWKVSKFVKEHNHELAPQYAKLKLKSGQAILAANVCVDNGVIKSPSEQDRIRELSLQLTIAKNQIETLERQAATYKRQLNMIFEHIEDHNQSLSKKIQIAVNRITELESKS